MNPAKRAKELHQAAWLDEGRGSELLREALAILEPHLDRPGVDADVLVDYGAILLDLNRNREALAFLEAHPVESREDYANLAVATAKVDRSRIDEVRRWNERSAGAPRSEDAILAYVDWQAM